MPTLFSARRVAAGAVLLLTVAIVPFATSAASGTTRWVNDDKPAVANGKDCGKPGYNSIQLAINASAPGDTVKVCAGTYAGATVDRRVILDGDHAVINTGPAVVNSGLMRVGFYFANDRSGSGTTIKGFDFVGAVDPTYSDLNNLDFGVFSRGADNVIVEHNEFHQNNQAITDHNGTGWDIEHNKITDLWTDCGGGIGIIVDGNNGTTNVINNVVSHNEIKGTLFVAADDCGDYTGVGITLYADFRYGAPGAPTVSGNLVRENKVDLVSQRPALVPVDGIELAEAHSVVEDFVGVIHDNVIVKNHVSGALQYGIWATEGTLNNLFSDNEVKDAYTNACRDDSTGAGTADTANTWEKNKGNIASSPAGICKS